MERMQSIHSKRWITYNYLAWAGARDCNSHSRARGEQNRAELPLPLTTTYPQKRMPCSVSRVRSLLLGSFSLVRADSRSPIFSSMVSNVTQAYRNQRANESRAGTTRACTAAFHLALKGHVQPHATTPSFASALAVLGPTNAGIGRQHHKHTSLWRSLPSCTTCRSPTGMRL